MKYSYVFFMMLPFQIQAGPAGDAAILQQLKQTYLTTIKALKEAKAQSDTLRETRDLANFGYESYDYIKNFDIKKIMDIIESDVTNLTEIDDMAGLSTERRYLLLTRELDRRIEDPKTSSIEKKLAKQDKKKLESILKQEDLINELYKNSNKNINTSAKDLSSRDSDRISAENLSILTRIELAREKDRLRDERAKTLDNASVRQMLDQQLQLGKDQEW